MSPADFPTFGTEHNFYLIGCLAIWLLLPFIGKKYMTAEQRIGMAIFLAVFTIFQEVLFDFFQLYIDDFTIKEDLSLHMCGFSLFLSSYALWKKSQPAFELAFFWGIGWCASVHSNTGSHALALWGYFHLLEFPLPRDRYS